MCKEDLLNYIDEISFTLYDLLLYLDTHPEDIEALNCFREYSQKRNQALKEYARFYGPLTADTAEDTPGNTWKWSQQPWPWEGGAC